MLPGSARRSRGVSPTLAAPHGLALDAAARRRAVRRPSRRSSSFGRFLDSPRRRRSRRFRRSLSALVVVLLVALVRRPQHRRPRRPPLAISSVSRAWRSSRVQGRVRRAVRAVRCAGESCAAAVSGEGRSERLVTSSEREASRAADSADVDQRLHEEERADRDTTQAPTPAAEQRGRAAASRRPAARAAARRCRGCTSRGRRRGSRAAETIVAATPTTISHHQPVLVRGGEDVELPDRSRR